MTAIFLLFILVFISLKILRELVNCSGITFHTHHPAGATEGSQCSQEVCVRVFCRNGFGGRPSLFLLVTPVLSASAVKLPQIFNSPNHISHPVSTVYSLVYNLLAYSNSHPHLFICLFIFTAVLAVSKGKQKQPPVT